MRIEPKIQQDKDKDQPKDQSLLEKRSRIVAIIVAFCGVFVWAAKILFF